MIQSLSEARPLLTRMEVTWVLGLILGGIEYGALVALGVCCLVAFLHSPQTGGGWFNRKNVLSAHVLLVLLLNTFLQIWNTETNIKAIFYTKPDRLTFFYHDWTNLVNGFLATLTEGVLVWRCYMVQKALSTEQSISRWQHVCWIFPAFLWIIGIFTWATAVLLLDPAAPLNDEGESASPGLTFFLVTAVVYFTLNLFAISNIVIRLLLHRRSVIAAFGRSCALAEHAIHISSIMLESAAINLPLALLVIIGLPLQADYAPLLVQVITPGQCIASILVIYQVAKGGTISEQGNIGSQKNGAGLP